MGLVERQRALARLLTEETLRTRFFADPAVVGKELGLNAGDIEEVARLSSAQVGYFAHSLQNKRLNEVVKLLPLTQRLLKVRFAALFLRFSATSVPQGVHKHRLDALAFADFLLKQAEEECLPDWQRELLLYERIGLQAADPAFRWRCVRFRHAIRLLARSIAEEEAEPRLVRCPTLAFWFRLPNALAPRHVTMMCPIWRK